MPGKANSSNNGSTTRHRNVQRVNAYTQALSDGASALSHTAEMPFLFSQTVVSFGSAIFSPMKAPEKIAQGIQGAISATRLGIGIAMLITSTPCDDDDGTLCKLRLIFFLLYVGILTVTGLTAENNKEPTPETPPPQTGTQSTDIEAVQPKPPTRSIIKLDGSTSPHRNVGRINAYTESASAGASALSPTGQIPFLFSQTIVSFGSAIFSPLKTSEKIVQGIQGTLSAARLTVALWMLSTDEPCNDNTSALCKAKLIFFLLYVGLLSVTGLTSENSKEPYNQTEAEQDNGHLMANSSR